MTAEKTFLAIETSTPRGSIAVVSISAAAEILMVQSFESARSHNALLFAPLQQALDSGHAFDAILVGIGPGSYTGVRIGISAALGVALGRSLPMAGIASFCALAAAPDNGDYLVVGDARRGAFFYAEVRRWQLAVEPTIHSSDELQAKVQASAELPILTCDSSALPVPAEITHPDAARLAMVARHQSLDFAAPVEPIYLRAPYITTPKPKGRPSL